MIGSGNGRALGWSIAFTAAAVAALTATVYFGGPAGAWCKMTASTGFLATALAAGALHSAYGKVVLVALLFCWWGDLFLTGGAELHFLLGLGAFLIGHVAFAGAFLLHGVKRSWFFAAAAVAGIPAALVLHGLGPRVGGLAGPVYAYTAIISLMVALAVATQGLGATRLIAAGAVLFYLSDLFVARQKFGGASVWNPLAGLPLYYAGQICLAASVNRARQSGA